MAFTGPTCIFTRQGRSEVCRSRGRACELCVWGRKCMTAPDVRALEARTLEDVARSVLVTLHAGARSAKCEFIPVAERAIEHLDAGAGGSCIEGCVPRQHAGSGLPRMMLRPSLPS